MTNELKTYTMQELFEQPLEPVEYLVDGLLAPGLYILGGSPKVGKSWMALQLCLAVCGGKAFLGRKTQRSEVLYLALEDGPQRLHSRALRLCGSLIRRWRGCTSATGPRPSGRGWSVRSKRSWQNIRTSGLLCWTRCKRCGA